MFSGIVSNGETVINNNNPIICGQEEFVSGVFCSGLFGRGVLFQSVSDSEKRHTVTLATFLKVS